jgi:hypothetical protein
VAIRHFVVKKNSFLTKTITKISQLRRVTNSTFDPSLKNPIMKKFLVLYHAPVSTMDQTMNMTPEQQAEGMKTWMDWAQRCGDKLIDMGAPLMNGQVLAPGDKISNSNRDVAGYSILEAENLQDAEALLKGHPHISGWNKDATIEVHETMPLPGM